MQRARRTAVLAVLALVGAVTLTGCREEPGVAIYIGHTKYSQRQVDRLAGELTNLPGLGTGDSRETIVQWIVARDLGTRLAAEHKWGAPQVDLPTTTGLFQQALEQSAQSTAASPGPQPTKSDADISKDVAARLVLIAPVIKLYAQSQASLQSAQQHVTPAEPSDADYADLYKRAKVAGLVEKGQDEATYRESLGDDNEQVFAANIGLRNMFADAIRKANVTINPRYAPAQLTLLADSSNHPLVVIPLDAKAGAAPARSA